MVFITLDGRFDREDGEDGMEGVYTITIIYDFTLKSPLCARDIIKLSAPTRIVKGGSALINRLAPQHYFNVDY